jgi:DNA-binding NtrC family response regulator
MQNTNRHILIADRNPHVRDLLKREMRSVGFGVSLAENGAQVLAQAYSLKRIDLLIIDPDLPDVDSTSLLDKLQDRIPRLPMIVHAFRSDYESWSNIARDVEFVEKRGSSIDRLKQAVERQLACRC